MASIEHVSDTARWVAVYRAMETERPDRIFNDPFARRLSGDRGQAIVDEMKQGRSMAWAMIVRTQMFDEVILDVIKRENVDLVVNLACGLDARAWRLDVPADLRWVDVDFPVMIDYETEVLKNEKTKCHYEAVATDLTDAAARDVLFSRLGSSAQRALIITEGLLIYLTPEQVGELAAALHTQSAFRWWVSDLAHPQLLKMMTRMWGKSVQHGNAPFLFGPAESTAFFEPFGWREEKFLSTMEAATRLKREMKIPWYWKPFMLVQTKKQKEMFRRFSATILLARA